MRVFLVFCFMFSYLGICQESGRTTLVISKQKDGVKKEFVIEKNDFVRVKLRNGDKVKGRISNISEDGFYLDTVEIKLCDIEHLGMNTKERRHVGQYLSAWVLGIGSAAAITGTIIFTNDFDTAAGLWAIGAISGVTSIYPLDLAYGKRKKFDLTDDKWELQITP